MRNQGVFFLPNSMLESETQVLKWNIVSQICETKLRVGLLGIPLLSQIKIKLKKVLKCLVVSYICLTFEV